VIALLSAPSNLGLRPPQDGSVPGCAKAPEAYREAGLYQRMFEGGAIDAGVVLPGRYVDDADPAAQRVRNQDGLIEHARRLADRLGRLFDAGQFPLVLGGDCSLLIGAGVALRRRGRFGLMHLDGHTDYRHPGNSDVCASVAGEDLAAATGKHWPAIADVDGLGPYFHPEDTVHVGCREDDEHLVETRQTLAAVIPARQLLHQGTGATVERAWPVISKEYLDGYWLHLDVDILDPTYLPAVDSPDVGGVEPVHLLEVLQAFAPTAIGAQVTIFDPDLDHDGRYAHLLVDLLTSGFRDLGRQLIHR